ncbi:MAG TPA: hypothetical protein VGB14_05240 [Acidimicrobiales bacterium]|jgi:hypothetical protein
MLLAELEIWHSRRVAPTRRVALGRRHLPVHPAPGFGGILLGAVVAAHVEEVDPDLLPDLLRLTVELEEGRRIPQPRLRYRFQTDRIGLSRSRHRLVGEGERIEFLFDNQGWPAQQVLGAVYAAGQVERERRAAVMDVIRKSVHWRGPVGPALVAHLTGLSGPRATSTRAFADPVAWALDVLGFELLDAPGSRDVQRRFRDLVRLAHPDHGGAAEDAAARIADLAEARRILLDAG